jgi:hypothetical protein
MFFGVWGLVLRDQRVYDSGQTGRLSQTTATGCCAHLLCASASVLLPQRQRWTLWTPSTCTHTKQVHTASGPFFRGAWKGAQREGAQGQSGRKQEGGRDNGS